MRFIIIIISFLCINVIAAQDNWFTDIDSAKVHSMENETNIMMVFAGSDWCRPCIQFKNEILEEETFSEYSNKELTILYLDFPARKKNKLSEEATIHNEQLAEKYNKNGAFPKIVLLGSDAEQILANIKYKNQLPKDFIQTCSALMK